MDCHHPDTLVDKVASDTGWRAHLSLGLARRGSRSVLCRRRHVGPVTLQRALYPEVDGTAHVMLLHPPGGLVQGDRIDIDVTMESGASALITTPSASKFYRTPAGGTAQHAHLSVAAGAALEWLPQEAILFDGARVTNTLSLDVAPDARAIAWDIVTLGRPALGERLQQGALDTALTLCIDQRPVFSERTRIPGLATSDLQQAAWGLNGAATMGTLIAYREAGFGEAQSQALREALAGGPCRYGVTRVDELMVVRCLGTTGQRVRRALETAWAMLRPWVHDKPACAPRIWAT